MLLITGLGNPGKTYAKTRHNIGQMVLDCLCDDFTVQDKFKSQIYADTRYNKKILFQKPLTFMNESGLAVKPIMDFYKLNPEDLLVIHDDMDLPLGTLRFSFGSRSGGHKGAQSIIDQIGSKDFFRLKIGIGHPAPPMPAYDFVTGLFTAEEQKFLPAVLEKGAEAISEYIKNGPDKAMNQYN